MIIEFMMKQLVFDQSSASNFFNAGEIVKLNHNQWKFDQLFNYNNKLTMWCMGSTLLLHRRQRNIKQSGQDPYLAA
ncbi:hypothetical protein pb186bvf_010548 [Paramecium bursaria]